jgi:hypothetical protein
MFSRVIKWGLTPFFVLVVAAGAQAAREPVLKQVTLPHAYYWRELYMPQLTSGPSAGDFTPDGKAVVYSMGGSLWLQSLDSDTARELTAGPGYDYQPDVSPDGRHVVFTRQDRDALELVELDLQEGTERALTRDKAAAVEPRYSPDGKRIVFVSSRENGRFTVYLAERGQKGLLDAKRLFREREETALRRYYYSHFDHVINPSFSPDGKTLFFVSNRGQAWGSGDIWSAPLAAPEQWTRVLTEETTWSARPELSPEGKRLLYASYAGRQWHQLWLTTPRGETPLPLSFGEFDRRNARWSPDGKQVLFASNENGNTSLYRVQLVGGEMHEILPQKRIWRRPMQVLGLQLRDARGEPLDARVSVMGADGRYHAPRKAWMRADDNFDRATQSHEIHYFSCPGECALLVPEGKTRVVAQSGFRRAIAERSITVAGADHFEEIRLADNALPPAFGDWISLDQHVHTNYGGHYRNTWESLAADARAEDLDVIYSLVVNKEQRVNDIASFQTEPVDVGATRIVPAQEFHTSYWGHTALLHLGKHLLLPDFSAYRHTALASPFPHNGVIADLAHEQGALMGYVHPFDWVIDPAKDASLTHALPADVAHGKVDYLEVISFAEHLSTADAWHRLLNLGFRLPAGAGTDAMANYASLRGPVGLNRVFLNQSDRSPEALKKGIREGRGFVSNAPLLGLRVDGRAPGDVVSLSAPGEVSYRLALRSPVPVQRVELFVNGKVAATLRPDRNGSGDWEGSLRVPASGWITAQVIGKPTPLLLDMYPFATTNPVWLEVAGAPPRSPADAAYFSAWIARVIADAAARTDWNTDDEKRQTLDYLRAAQARFDAMK